MVKREAFSCAWRDCSVSMVTMQSKSGGSETVRMRGMTAMNMGYDNKKHGHKIV